MSVDDDRMPMMEHEVAAAATASLDASGARDRAKRRQARTLLMAVIIFVLFTCMLIFLLLALIVPIFRSFDTDQKKPVNDTSTDATAADHPDAGHSTDHHHKARRSATHLVETLQQLATKRCTCLSKMFCNCRA